MPVTRYQPSMMSLAACISHWPSPTRWPWFAYWLLPRNGSSTDASTYLSCRNRVIVVVAADHELEALCDAVASGRLVWQRTPVAPPTWTAFDGQLLGSVAGPRVRCSCIGLLSITGGRLSAAVWYQLA